MIGEAIRTGCAATALRWTGCAMAIRRIGCCARAFDLLLLDLGLPRKTAAGTEVLAGAPRDASRSDHYGARRVSDLVQGLDAARNDYLVKPFDIDEWLHGSGPCLRRKSGRTIPEVEHLGVTLNPATTASPRTAGNHPVAQGIRAAAAVVLERRETSLSRARSRRGCTAGERSRKQRGRGATFTAQAQVGIRLHRNVRASVIESDLHNEAGRMQQRELAACPPPRLAARWCCSWEPLAAGSSTVTRSPRRMPSRLSLAADSPALERSAGRVPVESSPYRRPARTMISWCRYGPWMAYASTCHGPTLSCAVTDARILHGGHDEGRWRVFGVQAPTKVIQ